MDAPMRLKIGVLTAETKFLNMVEPRLRVHGRNTDWDAKCVTVEAPQEGGEVVILATTGLGTQEGSNIALDGIQLLKSECAAEPKLPESLHYSSPYYKSKSQLCFSTSFPLL